MITLGTAKQHGLMITLETDKQDITDDYSKNSQTDCNCGKT